MVFDHKLALQIGEGVLLIMSALEQARSAAEVTSPAPAEWLTTAEAAALVRRRPDTIREWVRCGRLKDAGDGRALYRREDVEAALRRRSMTPKGGGSKRTPETARDRAESILRRVK